MLDYLCEPVSGLPHLLSWRFFYKGALIATPVFNRNLKSGLRFLIGRSAVNKLVNRFHQAASDTHTAVHFYKH